MSNKLVITLEVTFQKCDIYRKADLTEKKLFWVILEPPHTRLIIFRSERIYNMHIQKSVEETDGVLQRVNKRCSRGNSWMRAHFRVIEMG